MKVKFPRTLQFFAEPAEPAPEAPTPKPEDPKPEPPAPTDYDELIKKDPALQSWLASHVSKASETAIERAREKWQRAQDETRTEAERLKTMTADEKAAYFEKKYQDEIEARKRTENAGALEKQTAAMFAEHNIPAELLSTIDFMGTTAEAVKQRVELLSGFEYFKKGEFEKAVTAAVNEKLKQKPPETHTGTIGGKVDLGNALAERLGAQTKG